MERQALTDWENAVDQSQETSLIADLPSSYPFGGHYYQEVPNALSRDWQYLEIIAGKAGARWVYWAPWKNGTVTGIGPNPDFRAIADTIFNGGAPHFVGMLGVAFSGKLPGVPAFAWVLISPRMVPPPESKQYEEKPRERYERSREVYDVEKHTSTKLP